MIRFPQTIKIPVPLMVRLFVVPRVRSPLTMSVSFTISECDIPVNDSELLTVIYPFIIISKLLKLVCGVVHVGIHVVDVSQRPV